MNADSWADFGPVLDRAKDGDRAALGDIWERYQPLMLRYLRGCGSRDAADVASSVWIEVAKGLKRFRGDAGDFRRWLLTIARRRHIDEIRRQSRRQQVPMTDEHAPVVHDRDVSDLDRALQMIRRLNDDQREAVLLRYLADMDVSEIAQVMGKSEGNVRVLVHRGLQRLQELMGGST